MNRIENIAGTIINPATEDTLELIALLLAQLKFSGDSLDITEASSNTGTITSVDLDTLPTLVIDSNPSRKRLLICTAGTGCYLSTELAVTPNHWTLVLPRKGFFDLARYTGPIWACTDSGTSTVKVTEFI